MKFKRRHIAFASAIAVIMILLVISLFFSPTGLKKYFRMKAEYDRLVKENRELEIKNEELSNEARALQVNNEYIEKVARDHIGMVKNNEVIFKVGK